MNFTSDNNSGICPEVMEAITAEAEHSDAAYGVDLATEAMGNQFAEVFERPVHVYCVPTGTAANALALAAVNPIWGTVMCHEQAHIAVDECSAPTVLGSGLTLSPAPGAHAKLEPGTVTEFAATRRGGGVHTAALTGLSLTQATEAGTRYSPDETGALCDAAHALGLAVHLDGARFANAVAAAGASPAELTWRAGVDIMSFGATKGGAMGAEAVVVFSDVLRDDLERLRKRTGHLLSKARFAAVQFNAWLESGVWLARADHANVLAHRLGVALVERGVELLHPVEANMVFALIDQSTDAAARAAGAQYYVESPRPLADGRVEARLVTSWSTTPEMVDRLVNELTPR